LLLASGAPDDMASALYAYNHDRGYVDAIERYAAQMRRTPREFYGYHEWQILYRHAAGTHILPVGYPEVPPVLLP
jgi:hypothetical protein